MIRFKLKLQCSSIFNCHLMYCKLITPLYALKWLLDENREFGIYQTTKLPDENDEHWMEREFIDGKENVVAFQLWMKFFCRATFYIFQINLNISSCCGHLPILIHHYNYNPIIPLRTRWCILSLLNFLKLKAVFWVQFLSGTFLNHTINYFVDEECALPIICDWRTRERVQNPWCCWTPQDVALWYYG